MSLIILILGELVLWIFMNRSTPFSTPRLQVLRDVTCTAAASTGIYAGLSLAFMQFTLLSPTDALWFAVANASAAALLSVRLRLHTA